MDIICLEENYSMTRLIFNYELIQHSTIAN